MSQLAFKKFALINKNAKVIDIYFNQRKWSLFKVGSVFFSNTWKEFIQILLNSHLLGTVYACIYVPLPYIPPHTHCNITQNTNILCCLKL